ncbi:hypothetical protein ACFPRL_27005 [Pseudoclavibacter helvolus]
MGGNTSSDNADHRTVHSDRRVLRRVCCERTVLLLGVQPRRPDRVPIVASAQVWCRVERDGHCVRSAESGGIAHPGDRRRVVGRRRDGQRGADVRGRERRAGAFGDRLHGWCDFERHHNRRFREPISDGSMERPHRPRSPHFRPDGRGRDQGADGRGPWSDAPLERLSQARRLRALARTVGADAARVRRVGVFVLAAGVVPLQGIANANLHEFFLVVLAQSVPDEGEEFHGSASRWSDLRPLGQPTFPAPSWDMSSSGVAMARAIVSETVTLLAGDRVDPISIPVTTSEGTAVDLSEWTSWRCW